MANPNWKKGGPSPNPTGRNNSDRVSQRNLAIALRECVGEEEIAAWLRMAAAGIDPDAKDRTTGLPAWKTGKATTGYTPLTWNERLKAMQMLLERRNGQAPQYMVIEAEVRAHASLHGLAVDLGSYSTEQLDSMRAILAAPAKLGALPAALPDRIGPPGVIDVESKAVVKK